MSEEAKPLAEPDVAAALPISRALTPVSVRLNETVVKRGFWRKVRRVAPHVPFAEDVVALWFCMRDPATPNRTKGILLAALAWFVLPGSMVRWMPALGFADDAAVIGIAIAVAEKSLRPEHREAARAVLQRIAGG